MTTEDRDPHHVRTIAPLPAGVMMTPEWHAARAALLRWLDNPDSRNLAKHHAILAKLIERRRAKMH